MSNWTIWPKDLNYKSCSFLQRNIQYRARLKGSLSECFRHCETFFKFLFKGSPFEFRISLIYCNRMDIANPKCPPFLQFSALRDCSNFSLFVFFRIFFSKFFIVKKCFQLGRLMTCQLFGTVSRPNRFQLTSIDRKTYHE